MDNLTPVKVQFECDPSTADLVLSLLLQASKDFQLSEDGWYCFRVNNQFNINNIQIEVDDHEMLDVLNTRVQNATSIWEGSAIFKYRMNNEDFVHIEDNVVFADI